MAQDGKVVINIDSNASKVARDFQNLSNDTAKYERILQNVAGTSNATLPIYDKIRSKLKEQQSAVNSAITSYQKLANAQKSGIGFSQLNSVTGSAIERLRNLALQGRQNSAEFQKLAKSVKEAYAQLNQAQNAVNNAISDKPVQKVTLLTSNFYKLKKSISDFENTGDVFSKIDQRLSKLQNGSNSVQTGFKALSKTNIFINSETAQRKLQVLRQETTRTITAFEQLTNASKSLTTFGNLSSQTNLFTERLRTLALRGQANSVEFKRMAEAVKNANKQLNSAENIVNKAIGNTQGLTSSSLKLNTALGALSVGYVTSQLISLGKSAINTSMDFQALTNRMNAAAGNKSIGADSLAYIREQADRLGLEFRTTANSFAGFEAAALRSGLTLEQTKQIFTDVSTAATSMQLSTDRVQLIFKALEQISGKGTVSMEELRQQLGDSLPGAFEIAAQSMGMTTKAFYDAVANGEVLSSEFLPKFAKAVREQLGGSAEEASTQLRASLNRLNTDLMDSANAWGTLLQPSVQKGVEAFRGAAQASTSLANTLNKNQAQIGAVATSVGTATTAFIALRAAAGVQLTTALASSSAAMLTLRNSIVAATTAMMSNPYFIGAAAIAAGIGTITYALQKNQVELANETQRLRELANETSNNAIETPRLVAEYHKLATATNRTGEQEQRLIEIKDKLNTQYPDLLNKYGQELNAQGELTSSTSRLIAQYIKLAEVQKLVAQQQAAEIKYNNAVSKKWYWNENSEPARQNRIKAYKEYTAAIDSTTEALRTLIGQEGAAAKVIKGGKGLNDYSLAPSIGGLGSSGDDKKGREKRQLTISEKLQKSYNEEYRRLQDLAVQGVTSGKVWDSQVAKVNNLSNALERMKQVTDLSVVPPFQALNTEIQKAQERVNNLAASKIVNLTELKQAKTELTTLQKKLYDVQQAASTSPYQQKQNQISYLQSQLQDMAISGQAGSAGFNALKNQLKQAQNEITKANAAVQNSVGLTWSSISGTISSQLSYALTTPLQQGENAFERLGNVALNIIGQIAQAWLSSKLMNLFNGSGSGGGSGILGTIGGAVGSFFGPIGSAVGGIIGNTVGKFFNANGNAFSHGRVLPFAQGGVVSSPTMFPMAGNRTGIMGEKGAEAIMPLKRAANGQLGVQAQTSPATVNIYNQSDSRIETVQRPDGETDVFIRRVNNALRNERTQAGFSSALQRNQSRGVQAS